MEPGETVHTFDPSFTLDDVKACLFDSTYDRPRTVTQNAFAASYCRGAFCIPQPISYSLGSAPHSGGAPAPGFRHSKTAPSRCSHPHRLCSPTSWPHQRQEEVATIRGGPDKGW